MKHLLISINTRSVAVIHNETALYYLVDCSAVQTPYKKVAQFLHVFEPIGPHGLKLHVDFSEGLMYDRIQIYMDAWMYFCMYASIYLYVCVNVIVLWQFRFGTQLVRSVSRA